MIDLNDIDKIYLFTGNTDFRLGISGLTKIVLSSFQANQQGNLFVFCSKNKKAIKILEFDNTGISLYHKKLNIGKYIYHDTGMMGQINKEELKILLNGLEFVYRIEGKTKKKIDYF